MIEALCRILKTTEMDGWWTKRALEILSLYSLFWHCFLLYLCHLSTVVNNLLTCCISTLFNFVVHSVKSENIFSILLNKIRLHELEIETNVRISVLKLNGYWSHFWKCDNIFYHIVLSYYIFCVVQIFWRASTFFTCVVLVFNVVVLSCLRWGESVHDMYYTLQCSVLLWFPGSYCVVLGDIGDNGSASTSVYVIFLRIGHPCIGYGCALGQAEFMDVSSSFSCCWYHFDCFVGMQLISVIANVFIQIFTQSINQWAISFICTAQRFQTGGAHISRGMRAAARRYTKKEKKLQRKMKKI